MCTKRKCGLSFHEMLFVLFAIHLLIYLSVSLTNYDLIDGGSELLLFPGCSNLGWLHIVSYQST